MWKFRKYISPSFCSPVSVSKHSPDTSRQATWQLFFISADWEWLWYIFGGGVITSWCNFYRIYTSEYVWSIIWQWICLLSWDFITYFYNAVRSSGSEDSTKLFQFPTESSHSALVFCFSSYQAEIAWPLRLIQSPSTTFLPMEPHPSHVHGAIIMSCETQAHPDDFFGLKGKRKDYGLNNKKKSLILVMKTCN